MGTVVAIVWGLVMVSIWIYPSEPWRWPTGRLKVVVAITALLAAGALALLIWNPM